MANKNYRDKRMTGWKEEIDLKTSLNEIKSEKAWQEIERWIDNKIDFDKLLDLDGDKLIREQGYIKALNDLKKKIKRIEKKGKRAAKKFNKVKEKQQKGN